MLRTSICSLLGASALALSGCTIYTNGSRPATYQAPRAAARPATPVRRASSGPGPVLVARAAATPTVNTPATTTTTATPRPGTSGLSLRGPKITAPILFGNGQNGAFIGEAFVIPTGTQRLPNLSDLVPFATLYTDSFEVKPQTFSGGFPGALRQDDWFAIRYEGDFMIEGDGLAEFALTSDDGAVLTIDGSVLITNDGVHTATTLNAKRDMRQGAHHLRLDYFQGARGLVALTLDVVQRGQKSPFAGLRPLQGINRTSAQR